MQNDSIDNLRLDLNRERVRGVIYVRRGDTKARTIHITLTKDGKVVDLSDAVFCEILIHKPDDTENDQAIVRYGNELQYTFRTSDLTVPGECKCMVQVTFADNAIITSPEFAVMVYNQTIDQGKEESTNEYTAISQILVDVTDLKNEAQASADSAAQSASDASDTKDDVEDLRDETKEYRDEAEAIAQGLEGAILPQDGVITFADLDDVYVQPGFMWKISDEFTTDNRFVEGSGIVMPANTFVFVTINNKFVCMSPTSVVGVKGDNEVNYRKGNISLSKSDIGLGNVPNVTTNDQTPTYSMAVSRVNIASGETLATALGKLQKYLDDLKAVAFSGAYDDLTDTPDYDGLSGRVTNLEDVIGYPYDPS